ncbi:transposase, partial [Pseudomonas savastanoi]
EKAKAQVRAKVEHPFRVIKRQFGYEKVRFRGLAKNTAQMVTLSGSTVASPSLITEKFTPQIAVINTANTTCSGFMDYLPW